MHVAALLLLLTQGAVGQSAPPPAATAPEVVVSASLLAAYQPDDDGYATGSCGQPATYLNCGPGADGGFGVAAGLHTNWRSAFVGVEASYAHFSVTQLGRLASGQAEATLDDTFLSIVAGGITSHGRDRFRYVAGATRVFTSAKQTFEDGTTRNPADSRRHEPHPYTFTVGFDLLHPLAGRKQLSVGFRYTPLFRSEAQQQMGLGGHAFRVAIGLGYRVGAGSRN